MEFKSFFQPYISTTQGNTNSDFCNHSLHEWKEKTEIKLKLIPTFVILFKIWFLNSFYLASYTLFTANFKLNSEQDGIIWVHQVDDPSAFSVVKLNTDGEIEDFIEKPVDFVSDLATIGIYYFKNGISWEMKYRFW